MKERTLQDDYIKESASSQKTVKQNTQNPTPSFTLKATNLNSLLQSKGDPLKLDLMNTCQIKTNYK